MHVVRNDVNMNLQHVCPNSKSSKNNASNFVFNEALTC
jgi:hypothetical protein